MIKNIIAGIIPGLLWSILFIILNKDNIKKTYKELLLCFILGGIGSYICYRLEMHYGSYFKKVKDSNYFEILFYAIFGVAIFEEGYKWFITKIGLFSKKRKDNILYISIFTSIGFATIENTLFYTLPYGYYYSITRLFTAFLSHICNAIWMGYYLEKSNHKKTISNQIKSITIPIILHGLYNSFLYGGKYKQFYLFYYIILIIMTLLLVIQISKTKEKKENEKNRSLQM